MDKKKRALAHSTDSRKKQATFILSFRDSERTRARDTLTTFPSCFLFKKEEKKKKGTYYVFPQSEKEEKGGIRKVAFRSPLRKKEKVGKSGYAGKGK